MSTAERQSIGGLGSDMGGNGNLDLNVAGQAKLKHTRNSAEYNQSIVSGNNPSALRINPNNADLPEEDPAFARHSIELTQSQNSAVRITQLNGSHDL